MAARWVSLLVLTLVAALSWMDGQAPSPAPADAPAGAFSAERAMGTVADLAREPRPAGSPAAGRVRDAIADRLAAEGLTTRVQSSTGVGTGDDRMVAGPVDNVVATLPGTDPTGAVVLAAHYDSVASGPGAADDMASVAAIVEAVRAVRDGPPLRNDLVVLVTDAEEAGLLGAQAWVRDELGPRSSVVVNFEARGTSGPSLMFETSPGNAGLVRAFADAVPHPVGDSSLVEAYRLLPNDTDLTRVLDAGRPGMNFAFVEDPVEYHSAGDAPANLSAASVQGHGEAALGLARVLGVRDLAPLDPAVSGTPAAGDATYFRFAGTLLVLPGWLVWPTAVLGVLAVAGAIAVGRRHGLLAMPRVLVAAGAPLVAVVAGTALTAGLWQLLVALRPSYADTGPFLHRPLPVQLATLAIAVSATTLWYLAVRRRAGRAGAAVGAVVLPALLGVVTAALAPGLSSVFAIPAVAAGAGVLLALRCRHRPVLATAAVLVPALALLTTVPVAAVAGRTGHHARAVPLVAAVAALALAAGGLLVDRPAAAQPQASHLSFLQDADTGRARWVSTDAAPAGWTAGYLDGADPAPLPLWPGDRGDVRSGPAAPLDVPGPTVEFVERTPQRLVLQVRSPRGAPVITLRADRPLPSVTVTPAGRPPVHAGGTREIELVAVPPGGVRVELTRPGPGPVGFVVTDRSPGLAGTPGFRPRPPELRAAGTPDSDVVLLGRAVSG